MRHAVDFYSREGRERCLWLYTWYTNPTSNSNFLIPGPSGPEKTQCGYRPKGQRQDPERSCVCERKKTHGGAQRRIVTEGAGLPSGFTEGWTWEVGAPSK